MSSDVACEEVGDTTFVGNRVCWVISKFYELQKNIRFKSPQFTLMGTTWQLRYCCFRSVLNSKEWLDIGVKRLSRAPVYQQTDQRVRFGITGNNLEISKTLEFDDIPKYYSLTLPYEDEMYAWVPEGNLSLFFAMEKSEQNCFADTFPKVESENVGRRDSNKEADENKFADASTQTQDDNGVWKLPKDFEEFLLNGNVSDVLLKVGEKEFKSHRCILAARSPVFSDRVVQETREKNILDIEGVDPNTFFIFMKYLYTNRAENITSENAHLLYALADEYQVYELEKICMDHMSKYITTENFCDVFALALLQEKNDLIDVCTQFFMKKSLDIVVTSKWQTFLCENPVVANGLYVKLLQINK